MMAVDGLFVRNHTLIAQAATVRCETEEAVRLAEQLCARIAMHMQLTSELVTEARRTRQSGALRPTASVNRVTQFRRWEQNARTIASELPDSADRDALLMIAQMHGENARRLN